MKNIYIAIILQIKHNLLKISPRQRDWVLEIFLQWFQDIGTERKRSGKFSPPRGTIACNSPSEKAPFRLLQKLGKPQ